MFTLYHFVIYLFFFSCIMCFLIWILKHIKDISLEYLHMNKNKSYLELHEFFCEFVYEVIYKTQILPYIASSFKPSGDELETIQRNFLKLLHYATGSNLLKYFSRFYGSIETFNSCSLMWFQRKLDNDDIIQHTTKTKEHTAKNEIETIFRTLSTLT